MVQPTFRVRSIIAGGHSMRSIGSRAVACGLVAVASGLLFHPATLGTPPCWPGCLLNYYTNGPCKDVATATCENQLVGCPETIVVFAYWNYRCEDASPDDGVDCVTYWEDCYLVDVCARRFENGEYICYTFAHLGGWIQKNRTRPVTCESGTA